MVIDTRKIPSRYFPKTRRIYTILTSLCAQNHIAYVTEAPGGGEQRPNEEVQN